MLLYQLSTRCIINLARADFPFLLAGRDLSQENTMYLNVIYFRNMLFGPFRYVWIWQQNVT